MTKIKITLNSGRIVEFETKESFEERCKWQGENWREKGFYSITEKNRKLFIATKQIEMIEVVNEEI